MLKSLIHIAFELNSDLLSKRCCNVLRIVFSGLILFVNEYLGEGTTKFSFQNEVWNVLLEKRT